METITLEGWTGHLKRGLSKRELEATMLAATDKTVKEIARCMDCAPATVTKRLDSARLKLGNQRTILGLCIEAMRRRIIVPPEAEAD